jgi:hypothetical protein
VKRLSRGIWLSADRKIYFVFIETKKIPAQYVQGSISVKSYFNYLLLFLAGPIEGTEVVFVFSLVVEVFVFVFAGTVFTSVVTSVLTSVFG